MSNKLWPALLGRQQDDPLSAYRARILYTLTLGSVPFLLPVAVYQIQQGQLPLGVALLFGMLVLACNALSVFFGQRPLLPYALLLLPSIGGVALALRTHGLAGALWAYPAVLAFHFLLGRRGANLCSLVQLVATTLLAADYGGVQLGLRFGGTLALLILLINAAFGVIDDLNRRLAEQSIRDPLTGAYNRRYMESCLDHAIERNGRTGAPATLLMMDIDHFRLINDIHGREIGDEILCEIVAVVERRARRSDLLFRIGGEEFLLLLPDTAEADAVRLAEDLRGLVTHTCLMQGRCVTVSIGVSQLRGSDTRDAWLRQAGDALYLAKEMGRDRIVRHAGLYLLKSGRA